MKFQEAVTFIKHNQRLSTVLLGPPGIGKTAVPRSVARDLGLPAIVVDTVGLEAPDISGYPRPNDETRTVHFYLPDEIVAACNAPAVLVFQDLPAAPQAVQVAIRPWVLDRESHGRRLHPETIVVCDGNRPADNSGAKRLPQHFINACALTELQFDLTEWIAWAQSQPDLNQSLVALLSTNGHTLINPTEPDALGRTPSPRQWAQVLRLHQRYMTAEHVAALVGSKAANQLIVLLSNYNWFKMKPLNQVTVEFLKGLSYTEQLMYAAEIAGATTPKDDYFLYMLLLPDRDLHKHLYYAYASISSRYGVVAARRIFSNMPDSVRSALGL